MMQAKTEDGFLIRIPKDFHGYKCIKTIGYGSTSIVELVEDINTGKKYSAKIISVLDIKNKHLTESIEKEIAILDVVDHPHIIKMREYFEIQNKHEEQFIVIILEYCEKGDLLSWAFGNKCIKSELKKKIIFGILQAVRYLHKRGISHGDIKSENILLTEDNVAKLSDFGFCRTTFIATDESKFGTLYYAAPELYKLGVFNPFKADIYAIGITLYSIFEFDFPFKGGDQDYIIKQTLSNQFNFNPEMDKQLKNLVCHCLTMCPIKRPTIDEVINHDFFSLYSNNNLSKINNHNQPKIMVKRVVINDESSENSTSSDLKENSSFERLEADSYDSILTY